MCCRLSYSVEIEFVRDGRLVSIDAYGSLSVLAVESFRDRPSGALVGSSTSLPCNLNLLLIVLLLLSELTVLMSTGSEIRAGK